MFKRKVTSAVLASSSTIGSAVSWPAIENVVALIHNTHLAQCNSIWVDLVKENPLETNLMHI